MYLSIYLFWCVFAFFFIEIGQNVEITNALCIYTPPSQNKLHPLSIVLDELDVQESGWADKETAVQQLFWLLIRMTANRLK